MGGAEAVWDEVGPSHAHPILIFTKQEMCTYSILSSKSDLFQVGFGLHRGWVLSPILFMIFKDRVSRDCHGEEGLQFGYWKIPMLLFAPAFHLQSLLDQFTPAPEVAGIRISTSNSEGMALSRKQMDCLLQVGDASSPSVKDFKYLVGLFMTTRTAGVVLQTLCCTFVTKRLLSQKAKLSIH